jgi:hypothetical protein
VNQVVADPVLTALPEKDYRGVRVNFTDVVNVIVRDNIMGVYVFGSGPVAAQEDARPADVLDVVAGNLIVFPEQIDTDCAAAAVCEMAAFDAAVFSAPRRRTSALSLSCISQSRCKPLSSSAMVNRSPCVNVSLLSDRYFTGISVAPSRSIFPSTRINSLSKGALILFG